MLEQASLLRKFLNYGSLRLYSTSPRATQYSHKVRFRTAGNRLVTIFTTKRIGSRSDGRACHDVIGLEFYERICEIGFA